MIKDNLNNINNKIKSICARVGRDPKSIVLVAVTKYTDVISAKEAIDAGVKHVAENYAQDAIKKFEALDKLGVKVTKHFIGHLQTNKVRLILPVVDLIQSVDSLKLAQEIEKQAIKINKQMDILVQVNIPGEKQKFGADKDNGFQLVKDIIGLKNIRVLGLMTMAPLAEDKNIIRECFRGLRLLRDEIIEKIGIQNNLEMKYLSMGMSADYEIALEEGANMLRIGSAIFK
ncbi:MAG TPA: YggS family pyridoxal phosphate-dependent enzyme [Candidatus Omnitrophota bacterium]|nr:YggS family pyridoxal phosphate-dependent enzyme [Candidatus Omnitrophota bacterium]